MSMEMTQFPFSCLSSDCMHKRCEIRSMHEIPATSEQRIVLPKLQSSPRQNRNIFIRLSQWNDSKIESIVRYTHLRLHIFYLTIFHPYDVDVSRQKMYSRCTKQFENN